MIDLCFKIKPNIDIELSFAKTIMVLVICNIRNKKFQRWNVILFYNSVDINLDSDGIIKQIDGAHKYLQGRFIIL